MSFFQELKRRNVLRAGAAYIVAAWLIIQVIETIFPSFGIGDSAVRIAVIALAIGFFPVVILAWAFELTPEGLKREEDVDYSSSAFRQFGKRIDRAIIVVLVVALAYFAFDKYVLEPTRDSNLIKTTTMQVERAVLNRMPEKSIAVLPFVNRSSRQEDEYFTDGIHDDLLTTIAKIGSITVISRTSVMEYRDTSKKIPQIAKELGVATILEGGVQRSGDQIRINAQLIDAQSDKHLWAESYDRTLTAENLFAIQSEISEAIANALQMTLSADVKQRLEARPTNNLLAYDAYLLGRHLMESRNPKDLRLAVEQFNEAVSLDPEFALAWVGVADSLAKCGMQLECTEESAQLQEEAVMRALDLEPNLGEAYASLGVLYRFKGRFDDVEDAFKRAITLNPNYARAWYVYAEWLLNFQTRIDEAIELAEKATLLDPRSVKVSAVLGRSYEERGLFSLAERQYRSVIDLDSKNSEGQIALGSLYVSSIGRYQEGLQYLREAADLAAEDMHNLFLTLRANLDIGDFAMAEAIRQRMIEIDASHPLTLLANVKFSLYENDPDKARLALDLLMPKISHIGDLAAKQGRIELILGEPQRALDVYLAFTPGWRNPEAWPELLELFKNHGCTVAWLMISNGEVELGEKLLAQSIVFFEDTLPTVFEHPDGNRPEICYLSAGEKEKALSSIETQLDHNHLFEWTEAHRQPMYDLIRFEPRYQAALQERQRRIAVQRDAMKIKGQ